MTITVFFRKNKVSSASDFFAGVRLNIRRILLVGISIHVWAIIHKFQNIVNFFKGFCDSDDWEDFTKDQLEIFDEVIELQEFLHNYSTNKSVSLTVTIPEEEVLIFKELMKKQPNWKIEE